MIIKNRSKKWLLYLKKWLTSNKIRNRRIKSMNGNGNNSVNSVHWNLGPRFWINKVEDLQLLVDDVQADIFFISEANLWADTPPLMKC